MTRKKLLCFVSSGGGHFFAFWQLRFWWQQYQRCWFVPPTPDVRYYLRREQVFWASWPEQRNLPHLVQNFWGSYRFLGYRRPDLVISNGAGVAPPVFLAARLLRIPTLFWERMPFVQKPTLTARLIYHLRLADSFVVALLRQKRWFPRATLIDPIFSLVAKREEIKRQRLIFVTVGTTKFPFDRLLEMADVYAGQRGTRWRLVAQIGPSRYHFRFPRVLARPYFTPAMMEYFWRRAALVFIHAGWGTVMQAFTFGQKPLVIPRQKKYGEHIDDHQLAFWRFLLKNNWPILRYPPHRLPLVIKKRYNLKVSGQFINFLENFLYHEG